LYNSQQICPKGQVDPDKWSSTILNIISVSVALLIQQAMRTRRIVLPSEAFVAVPFFFPLHYLIHGDDIRGKKLLTQKVF